MAVEVEQSIADEFGSLPILGGLMETSQEKARKGQVQTARETAQDYQDYRPHYQGAQRSRQQAVGGIMDPLNQLVQSSTGQSVDLGAAMRAKMVTPEMMAIGAPRPEKKEKSHDDAILAGAGIGVLMGDPLIGAGIGYLGSELDWW